MKRFTFTFLAMAWFAAAAFAGDAMMPVFKAYDDVRVALAGDSLENAQSAAKALEKAAKALESKNLNAELKSAWSKQSDTLMEELGKVLNAKDIENFRQSFSPISNAMVAIAEVAKPEGYHQFHCPMALGHKGADWLQANDEIANPYFGARMLRCGYEVKEGSK